MERPNWAPEDVDLERPSVARVYDYFLGGSHNFAADRAFAEEVLRLTPLVPQIARENRGFLRRAVRYLCETGTTQFIDLGSGIPTVGNVHEVAREFNPEARVAYVDIDPVAVAHSRALLGDDPHTAVVAGDLRKPADVLADPALLALIDFRKPVAFLMVAVLHFLPDEEHPAEITAGYTGHTVPGSHLVISHAGIDRKLTKQERDILTLYRRSRDPLVPRTSEEVAALFGDLTLIEPGVVPLARWRPDRAEGRPVPESPELHGHCGIGRKG